MDMYETYKENYQEMKELYLEIQNELDEAEKEYISEAGLIYDNGEPLTTLYDIGSQKEFEEHSERFDNIPKVKKLKAEQDTAYKALRTAEDLLIQHIINTLPPVWHELMTDVMSGDYLRDKLLNIAMGM